MAQKRINMTIQKEILRLKKLGHSQRKIARILGINKDTVTRYVHGGPPESIIAPPEWTKDLDLMELHREIKTKVPIKILYEELSDTHSLPSYQAFCKYLRSHPDNSNDSLSDKATIRIERLPGDSIEVDYSGDSIEIINPSTGEIYRAELFVGAMSYSSDFYAEFTLTQKIEDFISSHNNMFRYFNGVPKFIIPDNCKTAVIKTDKYDPVVNQTYHDMCTHYGVTVDPADAYSPRHKPTVEKSVHIIQQDFFPRIRKKTYTSLFELNRDLHEWQKKKREETMKARGHSRKYFFEKEKPFLQRLPSSPYELYYFKRAKVHPDCHLQHNRNFYSVPYKFIGKEVDVKFNQNLLHIFYNTERIATHVIKKGAHKHITDESHYPEKKIIEYNYHLNKARREARLIGPNMSLLVEKVINSHKFPLKNLRKVQGIVALSKIFDNMSLENAAELALEFNKLNFYSIKNFAKNYSPIKPKESAPQRSMDLICLQGGLDD